MKDTTTRKLATAVVAGALVCTPLSSAATAAGPVQGCPAADDAAQRADVVAAAAYLVSLGWHPALAAEVAGKQSGYDDAPC